MSLYEVLKASKTERFPDYWTLLWGRKMSASMIKTLTGTLPLTFTAKGGTAVDWVIYGNDENGTENLFNINASALVQIDTQGTMRFGVSVGALKAGTYTLSFDKDSSSTFSMWIVERKGTTYTQSNSIASSPYTFTLSTDADEVMVRTSHQAVTTWEALGLTNMMFVHGSTAPDHYIPYQKGVGERTEQLVNCSTISGGVLNEYGVVIGADTTTNIHADNGSISFTTVSVWRGIVTDFTEIKSDVGNVTLTYSGDRAANWRFCFYDNSQTFISQSPDIDRQTRVVNIPNNTKYFRASAQFEPAGTYSLTSLSIVKGSTAPSSYIPHGYQVPIIISQDGGTDKNYDIFVGSAPLTEGQQVSKTSTGQDIELFGGENTISTTLYNKPEMEIRYK